MIKSKTLTVLALLIVVFMNDQPVKNDGVSSADVLYARTIQLYDYDPGH